VTLPAGLWGQIRIIAAHHGLEPTAQVAYLLRYAVDRVGRVIATEHGKIAEDWWVFEVARQAQWDAVLVGRGECPDVADGGLD
jgi:hypothetical protein